jgi:hypothetical protein
MFDNKFYLIILRKIYRFYFKYFKLNKFREGYILQNNLVKDPDKTSRIISKIISKKKPKMISRFGRTEFSLIMNYLSLKNKKITISKFITGKEFENWWSPSLVSQIRDWSGFFPTDNKNLTKFCNYYLENIRNIDLIGVYLDNPSFENYFKKQLKKSI